MKKSFLIPVILILATLFVTNKISNKDSNSSERESYEKFLNSESEKAHQFFQSYEDLKKQDNPQMAAFQNYLMTIDPKEKRVPSERLFSAYKYTKERSEKSELLNWEATRVNMGGRTRTLMFDPNDSNNSKVWAGSVTGGLWYNDDITDANSSWIPAGDFWESLSVSKITYDPNNTNIFYAGTGEAETAVITYRESSGRGIGIMKSIDGGSTWDLISSTTDFEYITDIVVRDETGTSVIYASVVSGVYQGDIHQSTPNDGLYRSDDGGTSWTQVLPDIPGEGVPYSPSDLELGADNRIYVGTMANLNEAGGATILYSDLGSFGNWTVYDNYVDTVLNDATYNLPGRVKLAAAPSNGNVVYAFIAAGSDAATVQTFRSYRCTYILRTDDKGASWLEKNHPGGSNGWAYLAWHALIAKVSPTDENDVFIGGLDLYKTTSAGLGWAHISDWAAMYSGGGDDYVHADQHEIVFKPGSSNEIIFGTDGGVFYTDQGTYPSPDFKQRNHNYNTLQFYTCAIDPRPGSVECLGGLQDNGTVVNYGNYIDVNDMIDGGDGAYCFYDKDSPYYSITSVYNNNYTFYTNYNVTDSWYDESGTFVSPSDYNSELNTLYSNAVTFKGLYPDQILKITGIPDNSAGSKIVMNSGTTVPFSGLRVSPFSNENNSTIFLGTMSGRLFKIEDIETIPFVTEELTDPGFPTAAVSSISFGNDENTMLITFSNYGVSSVWASFDGGQTWEEKESNLPDIPVRWSIFHPYYDKHVLLATELGVWHTDDITAETVVWQQAINGMANVRVDMLSLRASDKTVLAATHGRGLYFSEYPTITDIKDNDIETDIVVYPNPTSGLFKVTNISQPFTYKITDLSGKLLKSGHVSKNNNTLDISMMGKGLYLVQLENTNKKITKKVLLK